MLQSHHVLAVVSMQRTTGTQPTLFGHIFNHFWRYSLFRSCLKAELTSTRCMRVAIENKITPSEQHPSTSFNILQHPSTDLKPTSLVKQRQTCVRDPRQAESQLQPTNYLKLIDPLAKPLGWFQHLCLMRPCSQDDFKRLESALVRSWPTRFMKPLHKS